MELKKDGVLFINLLFRVVSLIGFVSDYEATYLPIKSATFNWNEGVTNRVVLILANGLRDDFLQLEATPFLTEIAEKTGTFAKVRVEEFVTSEGSLRTLITGLPGHGSLLPWNRPTKYKTILDYAGCKCVIGHLPLAKPVKCHEPVGNQTEVFARFREMTPMDENDCLYVLSYDFGGFSGREYAEMLRKLDDEVRDASEKWKESTWLLTSSRGWSVWNRTDGRVDVPMLVWGNGIQPMDETRILHITDIPTLVNTLLGYSFPAGCIGQVPTYVIFATTFHKFNMILYNFEHMEKTMGQFESADEVEGRHLSRIIDEENIMSLKMSIDNFLVMYHALKLNRMQLFTVVLLVCYAIWSVAFAVVVARGYLTLDVASSVIFLSLLVTAAVIVHLYPGIVLIAVMVLLTPGPVLSLSDLIKSFQAEGHRMLFLSVVVSLLSTVFGFIGNRGTIYSLLAAVGLWPALSRTGNRMNKKILLSWFVSVVVLGVLPSFDVIGRDPTPGVTILSSVIHVALYHFAYYSFKRRVGRQSWVITGVVLSSTYHTYFCHLWGFTTTTCLLSWFFLLWAIFSTFAVRGTLLERQLKFHLLLLVPMQLLSTAHETLFHVALTVHMFSWVFTEHVSVEKTVLAYNPSIFTYEPPTQLSSDKLEIDHYRQVFFFLVYSYVSFFAVGNVPTVYTYDFAILKPFCNRCPFILIPLKLILPTVSILYTFLTLNYTQKRDSGTFIILSVHFSDIVASCFLTYLYILPGIFPVNASSYIILQIATATITILYFLQKYALFNQKT